MGSTAKLLLQRKHKKYRKHYRRPTTESSEVGNESGNPAEDDSKAAAFETARSGVEVPAEVSSNEELVDNRVPLMGE